MLIFLHIPKTAGTSFRFILENSFGLGHCHAGHLDKPVFSQEDLDLARKVFPRLQSIAGHNLVDPLNLSAPNPWYMTFVREPISRVFSHYQSTVIHGKNPLSFEQSLKSNEQLENLHVKLMAGSRDLDKAKRFIEKCSFVGVTERFDLSLHILDRVSPRKLNLNYKRKIVAPHNKIKESLQRDSRTMDMARSHNKLDLELYAFVTEQVFPRLCEKAGFKPSDKVPSFDIYTNELKLNRILCRWYNKAVWRQMCKRIAPPEGKTAPGARVAEQVEG